MRKTSGPRLKIMRRLGTILPGLMRIKQDLKRPYPPGQHGSTKRSKYSDYAIRLKEKQKIRFHYCVSEKKLIKYMKQSFKLKGNSGMILLSILERRLDNVIFRSGFAPTIKSSNQIIKHGHVNVNKKKMNISSYSVNIGDEISIKKNSSMREKFIANLKNIDNIDIPTYLERSNENLFFKITNYPSRKDVPIVINEQLIVEFYS